ncbi:MAG: sigma-54-dependent Fis family transcriptional regulator [Acidobacteria bacterium]|nr:MAG: sigma-54-dependent Fis family transcriptional regulator [Acidobacteriota bacterium]
MKRKVLVIDDEEELVESVRKVLKKRGYHVESAFDGRKGLEKLAETDPDVVLVDLRMPVMDGMDVLRSIGKTDPKPPVIVMTAYATVQTAVTAVKEGAFDYISKPFSNDQLELVIRRALDHSGLVEENQLLKAQARAQKAFAGIIGVSSPIKRLLEELQKVAGSEANVFIYGETGTGKEVVARALHQASSRREHPFVPLDCAALPENLLETELFGHEKGAFTGAVQSKMGLMEHASGGTLFLDEVAELALGLQSKLLRAVQEKTIRRVGSTSERKVDVRIFSASNKDLENAVAKGAFREDLFYRLQVIALKLPPLRERTGDIPLLAMHFFDELKSRAAHPIDNISSAAMMVFESYSWPGNVRELRNTIERALALTDSRQIAVLDLPASMLAQVEQGNGGETPLGEFQKEKQEVIIHFERDYLERTLKESQGNVAEAARRSGMERPVFHRLMRKHGIEASAYRRT